MTYPSEWNDSNLDAWDKLVEKKEVEGWTWKYVREMTGIGKASIAPYQWGKMPYPQIRYRIVHFLNTGEKHPLLSMNRKIHALCSKCGIITKKDQSNGWRCQACKNEYNALFHKNNPDKRRQYDEYKYNQDGTMKEEYLERSRDQKLKTRWGEEFWEARRLTIKLQKEIKNAEKT